MNKTSSTSKSMAPKKTYTKEEMEEMERKLADVWKVYGRDKAVGRDLYKMYGRHHKPEIAVPVPKTEHWDYKLAGLKEKKPCPQTTKIEYPKVITKQDLIRNQMMSKVSKLDAIPKRKAFNEIMQELALLKKERAAFIPKNTGVDRGNMIHKLQDKFKYSNQDKGPKLSEEEELKIQQAVEAQMRRMAKKNYFGAHGLVEMKQEPVVGEGKYETSELNQLNDLFDDVIKEVEERQKYLEEIDHLDMEPTKEKIKQEISSRVAELQKINKMIKDEKARIAKMKN